MASQDNEQPSLEAIGKKLAALCLQLLKLLCSLAVFALRHLWNDAVKPASIFLHRMLVQLLHYIIIIGIKGWKFLRARLTKELFQKLGNHTWKALQWTGHWLVVAGKAAVRGIRIASKATAHAIRVASKAVWRFFRHLCRWMKLFSARRYRAYQRFKRMKGFKGLYGDMKTDMKRQFKDYMEEGDEEKVSDAIGLDEYVSDKIGDDNKTRVIGQKIYTYITNLFK